MGSSKHNRAVFLDRDGVLTIPEFRDGRSYAPTRLEDFEIYPEAYEALEIIRNLGYKIIVVTNQPDINKGLLKSSVVQRMHQLLQAELPIDAIEVCPHTKEENCFCRKPRPGMLSKAASQLGVDTLNSIMIGDRLSDVEAGKSAGCMTVFIDRDYIAETKPTFQDYTCFNVLQAAQWMVRLSKMR